MLRFVRNSFLAFSCWLVLLSGAVAAEGKGGKHVKTLVEISDFDRKLIEIARPAFRKLGRKWTAPGHDIEVEEFEKAYLVVFLRPEQKLEFHKDPDTGIEYASGYMPRMHGAYMVWIDKATMKVAQASWSAW